jgi:hypothetical protein
MHSAPAVTVRERPILFSGPMVRAILDGTKTQTRRVILPSPLYHSDPVGWVWDRKGRGMVKPEGAYLDPPYGFTQSHWAVLCPFGHPDDRLWVRETWAAPFRRPGASDPEFCYQADLAPGQQYLGVDRWRPSIHMPRRASRISLELTGVRVERVQDICEADAIAEGIEPVVAMGAHRTFVNYAPGLPAHLLARDSYRTLWDSLNAARGYGWDANPWVWVLEFRTVRPAEEADHGR